MEPGLIAELLKLGWPGIFIALLIYIIKDQREALKDLQAKFDAIMERRANERAENAVVLAASAQAQNKLSESTASMLEKVSALIALMGQRGRK